MKLHGLALLSGVLLALAQPPYGVGWVGLVALVPFLLAAEERRRRGAGARSAAGAGYLLGLAHFGGMMYWVGLLPSEEMTVPQILLPAVAALVAYLAVFDLYFGLLHHALRARRVPDLLAAPLAWTAVEWLRGSFQLAFPWGNLGYAMVDYPAALQSAALFGLPGLSAWVVLVNAAGAGLILLAVRGATPDGARAAEKLPPVLVRRALVFLVVLLVPVAAGALVLARAGETGKNAGGETSLRVALVQPNVGGNLKWDPDHREAYRAVLEEATLVSGRAGVDLVVWPETAATSYLRFDPRYQRWLQAMVDSAGCPLLTGFLDSEPDGDEDPPIYNAAGVFLPGEGLVGTYRKMHLVPFGEEIPFHDAIPWLDRVNFGEGDFERGVSATPIRFGRVDAGILICFESIFPALARSMVDKGANLLVNVTNDSWFGKSPGPYQHAAMAVVRAVELRRSLVRSANTGVSMLVDPWGRVEARTRLFTTETLIGSVPLREDRTFYARAGRWVDLLFPALALVLILPRAGRRKLGVGRPAGGGGSQTAV